MVGQGDSKVNTTYKTAIKRTRLSAPARWLRDNNLLIGTMLDYGCGHGFDACELQMDLYDSHWYPTKPTKQYDTICSIYMLNVLEPYERTDELIEMVSLLKPKGHLYVAVRRDIKKEGKTSKGAQYNVTLPYREIESNSRFCIYDITKGDLK